MATLLQIQKKRDDALKAVAEAKTDSARAEAVKRLDAATLALAKFQSNLTAKTEKHVTKEERHEVVDDEEEEEESDEEEEDDEPRKPLEDEEEDDSDDDDDDDDSDDGDDDGDDEEDDEEDDESEEEEDEEEDDRCRSLALSAARASLKLAKKTGNRKLASAARESLRNVKRAIRPKSMQTLRTLKAECQRLTGKRSVRAILGALAAMSDAAKSTAEVSARVQRLEATSRRAKVDAMLDVARRDGKIVKTEVKSLREQGMRDPKWLKSYLETRPKIVRLASDGALQGRTQDGGRDGDARRADLLDAQRLSADQRKIVETAAASAGKTFDEFLTEMGNTSKAMSNSAPRRGA